MGAEHVFTAANLPSLPWLEVANPSARLGRIRHALLDFDGTVSVIRRGWEQVMIPMMVEMICDGASAMAEIEAEVEDFVDRSTGILTIKQMQWLEEAVRRHGLAGTPRTASDTDSGTGRPTRSATAMLAPSRRSDGAPRWPASATGDSRASWRGCCGSSSTSRS